MLGSSISRRRLLTGASAVAAAAATGLPALPALSLSPMPAEQVPYLYRFRIGDAQATVVSDGVLPLGPPGGSFLGLSQDEINKELTDNFLPTDNIVLEQNLLVVNISGKTVLFDT